MFSKKIGLTIVYYFLASLIDQLLVTFIFPDLYLLSFGGAALVLCIMTRGLRIGYITQRNYSQEEQDAYNESFKTKINHILRSKAFFAEMIICAVITLLFMAVPRIAVGISYLFGVLYLNRAYMLIFSILFVITDILIWLSAYRKCFKKWKHLPRG